MLASARTELAGLLEAQGLTVVPFLPERPQPPICLITSGDPYIVQGQTFTEFKIGLDVTLVASKATNEVATEQLDLMIEKALFATEFEIEQVGAPFALEINNAQYLAARVSLQINKELEEN